MAAKSQADSASKVANADDFVRQTKSSVGATGNVDSDFTKEDNEEQRALNHASEIFGLTDRPGLSYEWANVMSYAMEMLNNPIEGVT